MRKFLGSIAALLSLGLLVVGVWHISALAQTNTTDVKLSLSPPRFELSVNPGDVVSDTFRITNGSDSELTLSATAKNFVANDELGGVNLTDETTSFSLASWISIDPANVTVAPRTTQDFSFTINVPTDAEPGSHLGAIIVGTQPDPLSGSGAKVSEEAGPLVLVSVSGDILEQADIASFTTDKTFYENAPVTFLTRVDNTGNVHFKPTGTITIKNMFGKEVTKINLDEKNVLPGTIRQLSNEWSPGFKVGRYTADLTMVYGADNTVHSASTSFTIFPYKVIVPLFIGVILLLFVLIRFRARFAEAFKVLAGKR